MIALIRVFLRFLEKEHLLVSRYSKSHPHFYWYLSLDAIISIAIAYGGFQLYASQTSTSTSDASMTHVGAVALSTKGMTQHVRQSQHVAYWFGPKDQFKYSPICIVEGVMTVTYIPPGPAP